MEHTRNTRHFEKTMKICKNQSYRSTCLSHSLTYTYMCRLVQSNMSVCQGHVPPMCRPVESTHKSVTIRFNTEVYVPTYGTYVSTYSMKTFTIWQPILECVDLTYNFSWNLIFPTCLMHETFSKMFPKNCMLPNAKMHIENMRILSNVHKY